MAYCTSCGTDNVQGSRFCSRCGATLAPAPGAWRASDEPSTEPNNPPFSEAPNPPPVTGTYTPPRPTDYPVYNPSPNTTLHRQTFGTDVVHPAIPALISFFFPGLGLLFLPNKVGLGVSIFAGFVALNIVLFILAVVTLGLGSCLFLAVPLLNVTAAVHSYDAAAKESNGKYQPILFK